jgi:hypothetical protein
MHGMSFGVMPRTDVRFATAPRSLDNLIQAEPEFEEAAMPGPCTLALSMSEGQLWHDTDLDRTSALER